MKRIILASITVNSKHFLDDACNNKIFAKCGGITAQELTIDEIEYLKLINYSLHISEDDYYCYIKKLDNFFMKSITIKIKDNNAENKENKNCNQYNNQINHFSNKQLMADK